MADHKLRETTTATTTAAETPALISSERVNGTAVYGSDRKRIGTIDHLMIDKRSGVVAYAVMTFGGFLGLGQASYLIPWKALDYDESLDGYATDLREEQISAAPAPEKRSWLDRDWESQIHSQYKIDPYWLGRPMI